MRNLEGLSDSLFAAIPNLDFFITDLLYSAQSARPCYKSKIANLDWPWGLSFDSRSPCDIGSRVEIFGVGWTFPSYLSLLILSSFYFLASGPALIRSEEG